MWGRYSVTYCLYNFISNLSNPILIMDIERYSRGSRFSNNLSNDGRESGKSIMSLERLSDNRTSSLSRKVGLIHAMDIQWHGSQEEYLFGEGLNRFSDSKRLSNKSKDAYSYKVEIEEKDLHRKSHYQINHQCNCSAQECLQTHCICFLTPQDICVIGQCCPHCIRLKNEYLQKTRGFTLRKQKKKEEQPVKQNPLLSLIKQKNCKNMHYIKQVYANESCIKDLLFCTCKKSHCQKKYCLCYEKGVKCGEFCCCIECENKEEEQDQFKQEQQRRWERYATYKPYDEDQKKNQQQIDGDIQQFLENQYNNQQQFNGTLQFEPVNFDQFISHNISQ